VGEEAWRPHPQGFPGNDALALISVGGDPANDDVAGPMRPTPHLQRLPRLRQALAAIGGVWGRSRLMRLSGNSEVTPHVDTNYYWRDRMRVHLPIVTEPTVRFHCGEAEIHMAAGECWVFDTWRLHRVLNDSERPRIHLVADTVGGDRLWDLMNRARAPGAAGEGWAPALIPFRRGAEPALDYESRNAPEVMTPWEVRDHVRFLVEEAEPSPKLAAVQLVLREFVFRWRGLWACHGEGREGRARYRSLIDETTARLAAAGARGVHLKNGASLLKCLHALVFGVALSDPARGGDVEVRERPERLTA
jgi:hypothetical protein